MPVQNVYLAPLAIVTRRIYAKVIAPQYEQRWRHITNRCRQIPDAWEIAMNGAGMIAGTLTAQGVPSSEKILAMDSAGMRFRGVTRGDPETGAWRVYPLVMGRRHVLLGQDQKIRFNSEVADGVLPVPWEDQE
jgi:hypothetical protein